MVLVQPMLLCEHTQSCCYTTSQFPELLDMATAIVFLSLMSCNSRMNACQKSVLHVSNYDNMIHTESEWFYFIEFNFEIYANPMCVGKPNEMSEGGIP